jgi:hypothetical protein
MINYEELEAAESPEELTELEEEAKAEQGEGYPLRVLWKANVDYTGPWPENEVTNRTARALSNETILTVFYADYMELTSELAPAALNEQELAEMVQSRLDESPEYLDGVISTSIADTDGLQLVDSRDGEPVDGFTLGALSNPADRRWNARSDRMAVNGELKQQVAANAGVDPEDGMFKQNMDALSELLAIAAQPDFLKGSQRANVRVVGAELQEQ